jgi:hypothetical protein
MAASSSAPGSTHIASRGTLLGLLDQYLDAVVQHSPSGLPLAENLRATEDGKPTKLGEGIWKTVGAITYRQSIVDPFTGEAAFFGVALENDGQRSLVGLRLKQQGGRIAESETILVRAGDHPIFTPENMTAPRPVWDVVVPESERSPRAKLIAVADSYFDGIVAGDPSIVPLHPDCNRVENGTQTTNNPPRYPASVHNNMKLLNYITKIHDRRYPIVDEARGLVMALVCFDVPGLSDPIALTRDKKEPGALQPRSVHLFELFKVESGRIREILAYFRNAPLGFTAGWPA